MVNSKHLLIGFILIVTAFLLVATPIPFDEIIAGVAGLIYIFKGFR